MAEAVVEMVMAAGIGKVAVTVACTFGLIVMSSCCCSLGRGWQRLIDAPRRWMSRTYGNWQSRQVKQLQEENRQLRYENVKLQAMEDALYFGTDLQMKNLFRAESSFLSETIQRAKRNSRADNPNFVAKLNASLVEISGRRLSRMATSSVRDVDRAIDKLREDGVIYGVKKHKLSCPFTANNAEEVAQSITDALRRRCCQKVVHLVLDWVEDVRQLWKSSRTRQAAALDLIFYTEKDTSGPAGVIIIRVDASGRITIPGGREVLPYAEGIVATMMVPPKEAII